MSLCKRDEEGGGRGERQPAVRSPSLSVSFPRIARYHHHVVNSYWMLCPAVLAPAAWWLVGPRGPGRAVGWRPNGGSVEKRYETSDEITPHPAASFFNHVNSGRPCQLSMRVACQ